MQCKVQDNAMQGIRQCNAIVVSSVHKDGSLWVTVKSLLNNECRNEEFSLKSIHSNSHVCKTVMDRTAPIGDI